MIPLTHPWGKTYVWMMGPKFEPWRAEPGAHWAAQSCWQTPLMPLTVGLGAQTQGETKLPRGVGLCWT